METETIFKDALWSPSEEELINSNIAIALSELQLKTYSELYYFSTHDREAFWNYTIEKLGIVFKKRYKTLLDYTHSVKNPVWLPAAEMNIVDSCFQAEPTAIAMIANTKHGYTETWTYATLKAKVEKYAGLFIHQGFKPQDVIGFCLPMHPEAIALYLGIIKAGCTVCAVAESFAPEEIAVRLDIAKTKIMITQDFIYRNQKTLPLYEKIKQATSLPIWLYSPSSSDTLKLRPQDFNLNNLMSHLEPSSTFPHLKPNDFIHILFSSGTTGEPKAIPWAHTTPIKSASDAFYHHNLKSGDIFAWPTSLGWMMGPFLVFATLINKATLALYDGSPLDRHFAEFIQDAKVTHLGLVPSIVKQWRTNNTLDSLDWGAIKLFSSTGECSNPDDMAWLSKVAQNKPIIEYCGGTEIGGGYITGTVVQPFIPSTFTTPALGSEFVLLDAQGQLTSKGEVALIPPTLGLSNTLLNRSHNEVYYDGMPTLSPLQLKHADLNRDFPIVLRRHGDEIEKLANGYYRALGRIDDTMNLGGIKVSSAEIEQVLNQCTGVIETAAIAISPKQGGPSLLVIYYVSDLSEERNKEEVLTAMQQLLKEKLNPLFKIHDIVSIIQLPRTASNKIMRRILREQYIA